MSGKHPSSNDQRSTVKNPNNPAYQADRANRIEQGHPNPPPAAPRAPAPQPAPAPQQPSKK